MKLPRITRLPQRLWQQAAQFPSQRSRSLRRRLVFALTLIAAELLIFVFIILIAAGAFDFAREDLSRYLDWQINHREHLLTEIRDRMVVQGARMRSEIQTAVGNWLKANERSLDSVDGDWTALESLLVGLTPSLHSHLERGPVSGTLLMLDLSFGRGDEQARAGVLLRNLEPNAISLAPANIWMRYGPFAISHNGGPRILPQWQIEFPGRMYELYLQVTDGLPPDCRDVDSYFLTPALSLDAGVERAIYLLYPLVSASGRSFGVCGFELNQMMFKLLMQETGENQPARVTLLAPGTREAIDGTGSLLAHAAGRFDSLFKRRLTIREANPEGSDRLSTYVDDSGEGWLGLSRPMHMYTRDSRFANDSWSLAILVSQRDFLLLENSSRLRILLWFIVGFAVNMAVISLLLLRHLEPIQQSLSSILAGEAPSADTGILEIDDLLAYLNELEERAQTAEASVPAVATAADRRGSGEIAEADALAFHERVASLSRAERAVFDLYMEGHNAREITELLHLSINTIKTHNKRIYMKLGVGSRRELLAYVYYLEDHGLLCKDTAAEDIA